MYWISKEFHFSASHQLRELPDYHQCGRLHCHNYIVGAELTGSELNQHGFLRDYQDLSPLKTYIDAELNHRHLCDVLGHDQTTAERLTEYFYDWCLPLWPEVSAVKVSETPKTWAEYQP